jgi:prepilin-type N-terminal cleavage/methylation domain-containing protein
MIRTLSSKRGFTLIELMVALSVIAVLTVIATQTYTTVIEKGRLKRIETFVMEIDDALSVYAQKNLGKYPGLKRHYIPSGGTFIRMGPSIIGGNGGPSNEPNVLNQDDFLYDLKLPDSPYRVVPGQNTTDKKMKAVDELVFNRIIDVYHDNPLESPGNAMLNIAYMEYDYDPQTNDFDWVTGLTSFSGDTIYDGGLMPAFPWSDGTFHGIDPWDPRDPTTWDNYPAGHFAYVPLSFTNPNGTKAEGYWLIGYGNLNTLENSKYNRLLEDPDWPYFNGLFDDDDPIYNGDIEASMRILISGALVVRGNIYMDQLTGVM